MKKKRVYFKPDELERIVRLRGEGLTVQQIADEMGRSFNSIHCKIRSMRKDGTLSHVYKATKISPADLETLATAHFTTVGVVKFFLSMLGNNKKSNIERLDSILLNYHVNNKKCPYFGVELELTDKRTANQAMLMMDDTGRVMVVSRMARQMRGRLSHRVFIKMISVIYENIFTPKN